MDKISSSNRRTNNFNLEHFRIRLTARLGIILVSLIVFIPRCTTLIGESSLSAQGRFFYILSLPFSLAMMFIILFEYFLYKKLGPKIVKYSSLVDIILLLFFTADWVLMLISNFEKVQHTNPVSFKVTAMFVFTTFSWRTLMVTLIVQNWLLKLVPPVSALAVTTGYAIYYSPGSLKFILIFILTQLMNLIIIMYCEDRVKWKIAWASIQKDKWMQVNNFILNSLPENIMILDLAGEAKFISEYCKSFLEDCHLSLETKEFFKKVQDLQKQQYDPIPTTINIERLTTEIQFLADDEQTKNYRLEDLIVSFQGMIRNAQIEEKQFISYNGKLKIEDQKDKSLEVKISFVQHFENSYIILIIRDTTQRDLLVALEETNKYKDQLLASVSHELRAPLNGNINLVESAVNLPEIPESVKKACLIPALRSSQFLLHMINDILDMSQIKEKKLRLAFQSENLKETLKSTVQLVELQAKKKGIELLLEIDSSLPKTFCTDHIRLSQIVLNLLNNAIKFTQKGVIILTAKPIRGEESNLVQISVQDSGIGMTQENVQKLFSSYTHIEFKGRQDINPTGVGLGLNIAKNLAILLGPQDHQGILVTSVFGQGSTFTFTIENKQKIPPVDKLEDSCEIGEESSKIIQSTLFPSLHTNSNLKLLPTKMAFDDFCSCPKILIVDDNPFNTMAFETILNSLAIKCDSAFSGSSAIKNLLERENKKCCKSCQQFAVIFMDQEMPEMSGVETAYAIKNLQEQQLLSAGIKIIGCTAHKSKEEIDKFLKAGIDQCIHKPISPLIIKDILKDVIL